MAFVYRQKKQLSENEDDYCYLADEELGDAPDDPGTYEGGHAKPTCEEEKMNKWCVRECERCAMSGRGKVNEPLTLPDFSKRRYNISSSEKKYENT